MCIVVAAVMSAVYIVYARFNVLSFDRRERFVRPVAERMKAISEILESQISKRLEEIKKMKKAIALSSTVKVFVFIVSAVAIIFGSAVALFFSIMRKVFVNLLIGWKGMKLGNMNLMLDKFIGLVELICGAVNIPSHFLLYLLYPFGILYKLVDLLSFVDVYSLLTVTCQGAKSPIELFIDSAVLGVAILFIKSDYNFLWAMTFQEMNKLTVMKFWIQGKKLLSFSFLLAIIASALTSTNPFITMLRFFLSFVNFGAFFVNDHVTHFLSPACIGIEGFQNQELLLVDATSVLVWLLIAPMLYITAEIVCPKGGYTKSKTSLSSFLGNYERTSFVVTPLRTQDYIENMDNVSSSIGSVVVSEFNESDSSSIETGNIVISEYTFSDIDGERVDADTDMSAYSVCNSSDLSSVVLSAESKSASRGTFSIVLSEYDEKDDDIEMEIELRNAQSTVGDANNVIVAQSPSANSIRVLVVGQLRYIWPYVWLLCSADIMVVTMINAYLVRFRKVERVENQRQLRSHQRWEPQTIQLTIRRFHEERRRQKDTWAHFFGFSNEFKSDTRDSENGFSDHWLVDVYGSEETKLPPYYRLCFMVQEELCTSIRVVYTLRPLSVPLSYILAFSGLGHGLTAVGWKYWLIVLRKYSLFFGACLGIWTDETYEAYEIEDLVKEFTISDPDEATVQFIPLTIASRVILLQALGPIPTLISIVVINVCVAPLFVFSPKLQKNIPPLLYLNIPREVAVERERMELVGRHGHHQEHTDHHMHMEEWVITTRAVSIMLTESRLVVFLLNLVALSLTVMILEGIDISTGILALLLAAMLPYYVGSTLIPILYVGKRLNLTDEDFRVVFTGWRPVVNNFFRSMVERIPESFKLNYARFSPNFRSVLSKRDQTVHPMTQEENGQGNVNLNGFVFREDEMELGPMKTLPSQHMQGESTTRLYAEQVESNYQAEENDPSMFNDSDLDVSSEDISDDGNYFERTPNRRAAMPLISDHNEAQYNQHTHVSEVESRSTDIVISEEDFETREDDETYNKVVNGRDSDGDFSSVNVSEEDSDFEQKPPNRGTSMPVLNNSYYGAHKGDLTKYVEGCHIVAGGEGSDEDFSSVNVSEEDNSDFNSQRQESSRGIAMPVLSDFYESGVGKVADEAAPDSKLRNERDSDGDFSSVNVSEEDSDFERKAISRGPAIPDLRDYLSAFFGDFHDELEVGAHLKVAGESAPNNKQGNEQDNDDNFSSVNVSEEESEPGSNGIKSEMNKDFRNTYSNSEHKEHSSLLVYDHFTDSTGNVYVSEEDNDDQISSKISANEEDSVMRDSGNKSKTINNITNSARLSDVDIGIIKGKEYQFNKIVDRFADVSNIYSFDEIDSWVPLNEQDVLSDSSISRG